MNFPWYKHNFFQLRINSIYDEIQDKELFYIEFRIPSIIPLKKWQNWKHREPYNYYKSFDKCLDELNRFKNYLLFKDVRRKRLNDFNKIKQTWSDINISN